MTVTELRDECNRKIKQGYGNKPIYTECGDDEMNIDSIQKNTNPDIEPNYLLIMNGSLHSTGY